jgi:hypothetical protein
MRKWGKDKLKPANEEVFILLIEIRHVHGNGETGFYRPTDLLVKPYINLAVTVPNYPFFKKTSIFK